MKKGITTTKKFTVMIFISVINLIVFSVHSQVTDWEWAQSATGDGYDNCYSMTTDDNSNLFITGYFESSVLTFGSDTLNNADVTGSTDDIFLAKYDASGNVIWAQSFGGTGDDGCYGVTHDVSGNIYITGYFYSSTLNIGGNILTNKGQEDLLIAKFDNNGNVLWAKSFGDSYYEHGNSIATDIYGNVFITGEYYGLSLAFENDTINNAGANDAFIVKFAANGNVLWAKSAGGNSYEYSCSITTDASGNAYITGHFDSPSCSFDSLILNNPNAPNFSEVFLVKYNTGGNVLWARNSTGNYNDYSFSAATDGNGNVFIAGRLGSDTIYFGSETLINVGYGDAFLVKYDADGNVLWTRSVGGNDGDIGKSVTTDAGGNVLVTGYFSSFILPFENDTLHNTSMGSYDIFITKFDANGNGLWAKQAAGTGDDRSYSITADSGNNIFIAGLFLSDPLNFGTHPITNSELSDIFIAKLGIGLGLNENYNYAAYNIHPNPATDYIIVKGENITSIEIYSANGQLLKQITNNNKPVDISCLRDGMYLIKIISSDKTVSGKFIKE